jgi:hypothetical protein
MDPINHNMPFATELWAFKVSNEFEHFMIFILGWVVVVYYGRQVNKVYALSTIHSPSRFPFRSTLTTLSQNSPHFSTSRDLHPSCAATMLHCHPSYAATML